MVRGVACFGALAFALAAPLAAQPYPPQPAEHSWQSISTHAPELRAMLGPALEALPHRAPLAGIFRAEQQFVGSAMAYRLILVLADGSKWRVTLMKLGDAAVRATGVEPVP